MTGLRLGRLYIDGKPYGDDKPFPIQQNRKKLLMQQGFKKERIEIHYPVYPGVATCKRCFQNTYKPHLKIYDGHEYWICRCQKINYIN